MVTDAERLQFLASHTILEAVDLAIEASRSRRKTQIIGEYRETWDEQGNAIRCYFGALPRESFDQQTRDEDVRALALEHDERGSFGPGAVTEADNLPGTHDAI